MLEGEKSIYSQAKYILAEYSEITNSKEPEVLLAFINRYNGFYKSVQQYTTINKDCIGFQFLKELPRLQSYEYYKNNSIGAFKLLKPKTWLFSIKGLIALMLFSESKALSDLKEKQNKVESLLKNYIGLIKRS